MPYLSQRALEGLRAYKYKSGGYTILDHIHNPFWNWIVTLLPTWLAPNTITLTGLVALLIAYACSLYYSPDFSGQCPRWVYAFSAFSVVFYVNLDCIDGKQARRTNSSSPLGQLFDHGCDALAMHLLLSTLQTSLDQTCSLTPSLVIAVVMGPWLLAHLEEYHSGIMLYCNGLFGVMEGNYAMAGVHTISAIFGAGVWTTPFKQIIRFELPHPIPSDTTLMHVFFFLAVIGGSIELTYQLVRIFVTGTEQLPKDERGDKQLGKKAITWQFAYLAILIVLGTAWTSGPQPSLYHCRLASATYGLVYALVATQLIMAHMAKEPIVPAWWALGLVGVGVVNSRLNIVSPVGFTAVLCAIVLLRYLHYVTSVMLEVADFLGIYCFTITKRKAA